MAINPPSDIVLDVARAADPEKYRAALERLTALRTETTATAETFQLPQPREPATAPASPRVESNFRPAASVRDGRRLDAFGQFEAFVLQTFVQSMLPRADSVYGRGTAGDVWRSMLAERMGEELARSGQVGIAARLGEVSRQRTPAADTAAADVAGPLPGAERS